MYETRIHAKLKFSTYGGKKNKLFQKLKFLVLYSDAFPNLLSNDKQSIAFFLSFPQFRLNRFFRANLSKSK